MGADAVVAGDVLAAHERIRGQVSDTPFLHSRTLSAIAGCELYLKFENLQFTASFKERGALNRLLALDAGECARGVIAVSAGNHAQGVAWHAQRLGIPATIVMPRFAPFVKVENTEALGAEVLLAGETFEQARQAMLRLADQRGLTVIHPYDDPLTVAGQGTVALEMLETGPQPELLVVPVGGGGLIAGMAVAARHLRPDIGIVGVQAELYPAAWRALREARGEALPSDAPLSGGPTIADGIAVERPGELTMALIRRHVDEIRLVSEARLEQAVVTLLEIEKSVVEGAGAAGLAAVLDDPARFAGRRVGLVLSGGNIDPLTLADAIQRQMVRTRRLARLRIGARDAPGALAAIATVLGAQGANIVEVNHQRAFAALPVHHTRIEVTVSTRGPAHLARVVQALHDAGFDCADVDESNSG
ncbi:threonine ammonia-lyase [Quisquiliibacterium transsilvanicum]|uniref:Threonine dehydratase n=1 Tax=Quisquiliibacterium transsilvanicum TaxID=1549638 RepID=A0A7W8HFC5_9BURK|nr:threonine ammonia-lyase [Quisquiliibacterium transsilvanicum]MBB5270976.1 threonine dehydratase [Quisquiliibacterium transsilvanicum]